MRVPKLLREQFWLVEFAECLDMKQQNLINKSEIKSSSLFRFGDGVESKSLRQVKIPVLMENKNSYYNPGQNIWNKMEQPSITGQEKKRLVSVFAYFLTATHKF